MQAFCRTVLVMLLIVSLADLPAAMAANRALGFVLAAQSSQIDGASAANGTNVFVGDTLATAADGAIHLQFGANQIYMPESSALTLGSDKDSVTAALSTGTVGFSTSNGFGIQVQANDVLIRAKTPQATQARVTVLAPDELAVASVAGPLTLELDGESYTIEAGRTYGVRIVQDPQEDQKMQTQPARRRRRLLFFLIFGTAAAAIIIELLHHKPHESQFVP